jgi:hypothetical protein
MLKASIVILNWNRVDDTLKCLESVRNLERGNFELTTIVIDNASNDDSAKKLRQVKDIDLIVNSKNLGFSGGNNVGITYALRNHADYVIILNNDTVVEKESIKKLVEYAKANPKVGAISPKIYFEKGFEFHKGRYNKEDLGKVIWYAGGTIDWNNVQGSTKRVDEVDKGGHEEPQDTDFATGTCMLLARQAIEKGGMFDEKYFMYYEDTDLSLRIKNRGLKVVYFPKSIIWHKVAQSSTIGGDLNDYFITRNRMLFGLKYAPLRAKLALIRESLGLLLSGRPWQKKGIRDYYLGNFGKGSWK